MNPIPVYVLPRVPGATETTEWTTFCHSKNPFVVVSYDTRRNTSRWQSIERKKPFKVTVYTNSRFGIAGHDDGWFKTFDEAKANADKTAIVQAELVKTRRREREEAQAAAQIARDTIQLSLSKREVTALVNALLIAKDKHSESGNAELSEFMRALAHKLMEDSPADGGM